MDPATIPIKDIHLPHPVSWWPPAPGWWLLMTLCVVAIAWVAHRLRTRANRPSTADASVADAIRDHWTSMKARLDVNGTVNGTGVREVSEFLRRASLSLHPREQVAGLSGESWLAFLDRTIGGDDFRRGVGRLLIDAPYRRDGRIDPPQWQALMGLCDRWVARALQAAPEAGR